MGSYSRDTAIHPGKDVDPFTKLKKLGTSENPWTVFEGVRAGCLESFESKPAHYVAVAP